MPMLATPPRRPVPEKNTEPLSTTVTPTTKARVRKAADQAGISIAEWLRRVVNQQFS